jgi:uncharacterized iron-regulated protein
MKGHWLIDFGLEAQAGIEIKVQDLPAELANLTLTVMLGTLHSDAATFI